MSLTLQTLVHLPLPRVELRVFFQMRLGEEGFAALNTQEGAGPGVVGLVLDQVGVLDKPLSAEPALERPVPPVQHLVLLQVGVVGQPFAAYITFVLFLNICIKLFKLVISGSDRTIERKYV